MCRIMHTVSEGSGGLLKETSDYSGGSRVVCVCVWGGYHCPPSPTHLDAAPPSGESVILPVKVTPKTHNSQTGSRKSTGSGQPSATGPSSGEETVWHIVGVVMTNEKMEGKSQLLCFFFFVFFSTS